MHGAGHDPGFNLDLNNVFSGTALLYANCFTVKRYQQIYELLLNFIVMQKYISHVKDLLCIKAQQAEYFKY